MDKPVWGSRGNVVSQLNIPGVGLILVAEWPDKVCWNYKTVGSMGEYGEAETVQEAKLVALFALSRELSTNLAIVNAAWREVSQEDDLEIDRERGISSGETAQEDNTDAGTGGCNIALFEKP